MYSEESIDVFSPLPDGTVTLSTALEHFIMMMIIILILIIMMMVIMMHI